MRLLDFKKERGWKNLQIYSDTKGDYTRAYVAYQRRMLPAIARRARLVITVSEFARAELVEVLGAAPGRVRVIAPGVDAEFGAHLDPALVGTRYGLARPYVLAVGTVSPRKHLAALEPVAAALGRRGIDLVIAGDTSYPIETFGIDRPALTDPAFQANLRL